MELTSVQLELLHKHLITLLGIFDDFCRKNNLKYYLIGGSALGAMRHGGIIPWDDDIDIGMPRKDYETFLRIYPTEGINCAVLKTNTRNRRDHVYPWAKIEDCTTHLVVQWHEHIKPQTGVFIDLFPLDGAPESKEKQIRHISRISKLRILLAQSYTLGRSNNFFKRVAWKLIRTNLGRQTITIINNILLKKYSFENTIYVGNLMGEYGMREIVSKDIFGIPKEVKFEGLNSFVPERTEEYLTKIYGDNWQQLPPVEKRKSLHDWSILSF